LFDSKKEQGININNVNRLYYYCDIEVTIQFKNHSLHFFPKIVRNRNKQQARIFPWSLGKRRRGSRWFPVIDSPGWTIPHRRAESARARRCAHRDPVDAEGHARAGSPSITASERERKPHARHSFR